MSRTSLVSHIKKQATSWTFASILLTATLSASLFFVMIFKDAEHEALTSAESIVSSSRSDLLQGDVRTLELRLRKQFDIKNGERLLFIDSDKKPWVADTELSKINFCEEPRGLCKNILANSIKIDYPIYFDGANRSLWGYFHIEKHPNINWPMIVAVILAIIFGMLFQAAGFYFNIIKEIKIVGKTLVQWAGIISTNQKNISNYPSAPYSEIEPIEKAIFGLKKEIDLLEDLARDQGALKTLRGISHDILNPVSRMKRILGLIEKKSKLGPNEDELFQHLGSNLKRLSTYAEQLKLLYKFKTGEMSVVDSPSLNLSDELKKLATELAFDPEVAERRIEFSQELSDDCFIKVPAPILGRIVENIVGNSIHASNDGGIIRFKTTSDKDSIHLSIQDEGDGIAEEIKDKIFFADFTTKTNKGTGLGLFVVKQLCENYGGLISLESQVGYGTTIKLSFPRAELIS